MKKSMSAFGLGLVLLTSVGCTSSTRFVMADKAEDVGPVDFTGKKVAAMVIHRDEAVSEEAEDALAAEISKRGPVGVPAHTFLPDEETLPRKVIEASLQSAGVEYLVVTRLAERKMTAEIMPSFRESYYSSFGNYYDYSRNAADATVVQNLEVVIETLCYRVSDGRQIWAGVSETRNPASIASLVQELVEEAGKVMKKQGLVAK